MSKLFKFKLFPVMGFLLLTLAFFSKAEASDLDIFNVVTEDVTPNVLLIIDISGSMDYDDVWDEARRADRKRLDVVKEVVEDIIRDNPTVKWGLFTFPNARGETQSGELVAECRPRNPVQLESFIRQIRDLKASGGTPVASALAEARLYFAGANSFFWSGYVNSIPVRPYRSPIENECQYNNIILLTDGFSSVDSGVKGGYNNVNYDDKYYMYNKNSIFLRPYLDNRIIGDYITRKTFAANPDERIDLGSQLAGFVNKTYWTAAQNDQIKGGLVVYENKTPSYQYMDLYNRISWGRVETGTPTNGDTRLRTYGQLTPTRVKDLINQKIPFIYGYNANDPSRLRP